VDRVIETGDELAEPTHDDKADQAGHQEELGTDQDTGSTERPAWPSHEQILRYTRMARALAAI
jgi:hypothetical protein